MKSGDCAYQTHAFFLDADIGQRYCLYHAPTIGSPRASVLYLHPFAEEMHAARRVVAQQCRQLAASGYAVLQVDLLGCGDSSGDFGDATWSAWQSDAQLGLQWLKQKNPESPSWIWGLRAGCLLACSLVCQELTNHPDSDVNLLFWQPPASGRQQLQQFLRLQAAAQWLGRASATPHPTQLLAEGRPARVAGYDLSPTLARELEQAALDLPPGDGRIAIIEMTQTSPSASASAESQPAPSAWLAKCIERWSLTGWTSTWTQARSPLFWQNVVESHLSAELDQASQRALA